MCFLIGAKRHRLVKVGQRKNSTYVRFVEDKENKVPSSSQSPDDIQA